MTWVAVDWGTSNLRVWIMGDDDRPLARITSARGMSRLRSKEYEGVLLGLVAGHFGPADRIRAVCCGMVGARTGWVEAPYRTTPCPAASGRDVIRAPVADPRLDVAIAPGVKQADPADVMRGEETQIAGFLALEPDFSGTICLPGTHSKWVRVEDGHILNFRTFMSGELFETLCRHTILCHSVADEGWDEAAFLAAAGPDAPAPLVAELFGIRAAHLLNATPATALKSRLSGLILGAELEAARAAWQDRPVALIGDGGLVGKYAVLLSRRGVATRIVDAETATLAGLVALFREIGEFRS